MTSQIQRVRGLAFDETQDPARTRPQPTPETHHCTSSTNLLPAMNSTDCELSLQSSHFSHYSHSSGDFLDPEEEEVAPHLSSIEATATPYALPSNLSTHRHKRRRATPFKCNKENQCERQTDSSGGTSRNASDDAIQGISLFQKGGRPRNPKSSRQDRWAPMDLTQLEPWKSIRQLDPLAQIEYYWAHLYGNDSHEAFGDTSNSMAGCSGAWSAQRLPPTKGCLVNSADDLSKRPQVENTTAARTETNYDTPLRNGFQSLRYTTPKSSPDDKPKRTVSHNRKVQFGSIQAVVYYVDDPPPVWTEIPEDEASRKYSLDPPEPDNNAEELTQETKDNAAVLAEWDDDWDNVAVFEDAKDDEEELMFSLPAPPSRKTNRRRSSIFSPSGAAINLLECLPEQVEYPENKVVSESPEQALIDSPEMLGLQGLTNLSVQSPPVVEIAECTHSSPEDDSGSPSDLMKSFNKSPNDVRDVRETAVCLANLKRPVFWIRQSPSATNIWQSVLDAPSHVDFVYSIIDPQTALRNLSRLDNSNTTSPKKDSLDWMDALPNSFTCIKNILKFVTEEFRAESSNQNFQRNLDDLGLSDQRHGLPGYLKRQYEKEVLEFETRILDTILLQSKGLHREIVACAGKISTCTYQLSHFELCGSQRILDKCRQAVEQLETRLQDAKDYAEEMRRQNLVADLVLAKEIASKVGVQDHLTPFRIKWAPNQGTTGPCRCEFASAVTGTQLSVLTDTQFEVNDVRVETSPTFQIFRSVPSDSTAARLYEALAQDHANVFSRSNGKAMWDAIDILEHIGIFQQRLNQVVLEVYAISQVYQVTMKSVGNRHMISVELPGTASIHIVYLSTHPRCIAYSMPSAIRVLRNGDVVDRLPKIFTLAVSECSVELCGRLLQRLCDSQSVVV